MTTYFIPMQTLQDFHRRRLLYTVNGMVLATANHIEEQLLSGNGNTSFPKISFSWMDYFIYDAQYNGLPITGEHIIFAVYFSVFIRLRSRFARRDMLQFKQPPSKVWPTTAEELMFTMEDFHLE